MTRLVPVAARSRPEQHHTCNRVAVIALQRLAEVLPSIALVHVPTAPGSRTFGAMVVFVMATSLSILQLSASRCRAVNRLRPPLSLRYSRLPGFHPRVCGEAPREIGGAVTARGSIPARAGKPAAYTSLSPLLGVHPRACGEAGNSRAPRPAGGVHPRACGEALPMLAVNAASTGPSPRVRGSPDLQAAALV